MVLSRKVRKRIVQITMSADRLLHVVLAAERGVLTVLLLGTAVVYCEVAEDGL